MKKKGLSLLLAIALYLGMLPAQALAAEWEFSEAIEDVPPVEDPPPAENVPPVEDLISPVEPPVMEMPTEPVLMAETPTSGTCGEKGEDVTWALDGSGTLTISGTGKMFFSSVFQTAPWNNYRTSVKTVVITPGVRSIFSQAFDGCTNLTSITIPDSIESIGYCAFQGCSKLESIRIPSSMTQISNEAFKNSGLTSITIPSNIVYIGASAFEGCRNLTSITIPNSVKTISNGAFKGCRNLSSVTIPNGLTAIDGVFEDCSSLESVIIPDGVKSIGKFTFSGCKNLTNVAIPDSVTSIKEGAFKNCSNLENIAIPSGVVSIESNAFESCSKLKNITLPDGLDVINYRTFYRCSSLTDVTIPDNVLKIGGGAFAYCQGLTGITIPSSVTSIGIEAFAGCDSVTSLTFPDSGVSLDEKAFSGCSGLTSLTIPGRMTSVGTSAFFNCSGLISVTLEEGVRSISNSAFRGCSNLIDVTIPDSVTYIGNQAFLSCGKLAGNLNIPTGVQFIGESAFSGCSSLTGNVTIPAAVKGNLGKYAFRDCQKLESLAIKEGVTSIGERTFQNCSQLTSISIPSTVTAIGRGAFTYCSNIADIYYAGTREEWEALITVNSFTPPEKARIHFNSGETIFNVTLNPNSGRVDPKTITVSVGEVYGELPTPTRDKYIFKGWFTAAEGGEQVAEDTIVLEEDAGRTLYAHWATPGWLEKMTYSFGNSAYDFGYSAGYKIPYERYVCIFGDTPRAKQLFDASGAWGGNCFGMSSTSAMFSQTGSGVSVSAFRGDAARPYDLAVSDTNEAWDLTLRKLIETMQIAQKSQRINRHWSGCSLDELCAQAKAFKESGKAPPVVDIWGALDVGTGGHAMLVYDLVDISPSESRLMVYDPNYPDTERYIRIDRSNGAYTGWYYHLNDSYDWGTGYSNARIAYIPYSDYYGTWTEKPVAYSLSGRAAALPAADEESALLIFNSDNANILDAEGRQIAAVENGLLKTDRTDIFPLLDVGVLPDGTVAGSENTILFLPPDQYTIQRETDSGQTFDAVMVHVGQSAAVTTSGSSVTFAVDDGCELNYARVNGSETGEYTITLESSLLEKPEASLGTFYTVTASGSLDKEGASAAQVADGLFSENVPAENVKVNGFPVSAEDLGNGGTLSVPAVLNSNLTATLQGGSSVVLSRSPSSVAHVYAASYNSDGRMTEFTTGTLDGSTIQFSKPVTEGTRIFLLDGKYAPVSGNIVAGK